MRAAGILTLVALVACKSHDSDAPPPAPDAGPPRTDDATAADTRGRCGYGRGDPASRTLGASAPVGQEIPIDTIVVIIQENRSFDHYFSSLSHGGVRVASPVQPC